MEWFFLLIIVIFIVSRFTQIENKVKSEIQNLREEENKKNAKENIKNKYKKNFSKKNKYKKSI